MKLKPLGNSEIQVSAVGLGCMNFGMMCDQAATTSVVDAAIEADVNFFDVADIYGGPHGKAEELLGKALGSRRCDIILATKFGAKQGGGGGAAPGGGSREYIMKAIEDSLQRLGTDYIDLYQHHFPDSETPVDETLRALADLVQQGKVRAIGCSNYTGAMLAEAAGCAASNDSAPFVAAQNRYSLLTRDIETDLVPVAEQHGVGILPYFPLESGLLTGKYRKGEKAPADTRFGKWGGGGIFASDERYEIVDGLREYGDKIGHSVLDIAIGWLAAQPHVSSVIAGVTKPEQITSNAAAASWTPTAHEVEEISRLAGA
ncbi:MAG: aldo/keto reductase [Gammaproteobacteria bacterium]|nr:aldo/keto reductase [Gammaproteobacteria bacterium]